MNIKAEDLLLQISDLFSSEKTHGYGFFPLPCDIDEKVNSLIEIYKQSSSLARDEIRSFFSDRHSFGWICFSERMSVLAVRKKIGTYFKWANCYCYRRF